MPASQIHTQIQIGRSPVPVRDMISGERQKVMQKAVRWPCGVCDRGVVNNSI